MFIFHFVEGMNPYPYHYCVIEKTEKAARRWLHEKNPHLKRLGKRRPRLLGTEEVRLGQCWETPERIIFH